MGSLWAKAKVDPENIRDTQALDWTAIRPEKAAVLMIGCMNLGDPRGLDPKSAIG